MTNQNLIAAICAAYTVDELAALAEDVGADDNETLALIEDRLNLLTELAASAPSIAINANARNPGADVIDSMIAPSPEGEVVPAYTPTPTKVKAVAAVVAASKAAPASPPITVTCRAPNSRTELGNVERMLKAAGDNLMYAEDLQAWFEWNGVYWSRTSEGRIIELCAETVKRIADEASAIVDDDDRIAFLKFAANSQKKTMISSMAFLAAADRRVRIQAKDLDSHSHVLGVKNGAVDLRTGAFLAPDKAARITVVAGTSYNPDAKCPLFEQTVLDSQGGDLAMVGFLQRLLGHTIMGNATEEIMVIPYGNGSNGKSTIFGAVRLVLGDYARAADASSFMNDPKKGSNAGGPREDILRLRGARFVYVSEPEENSELKESFVKAMTGGDAMPARGVNAKTTIEERPTWVPIMPTNHRPIIKGDDFAIWRRIVLLPFLQKFDKSKGQADLNRKAKLMAEAEGILAWLVQGAIAYQADGLRAPAEIESAKSEYKRDMDLLGDWLEDCCELDDSYKTPTEALWTSWSAFAERRGELGYIKSHKKLATKLGNRNNGADFYRVEGLVYLGKRARGFAGLRLKKLGAVQASM